MGADPHEVIEAEFGPDVGTSLEIIDADEQSAFEKWKPILTGLESACYNVGVAAAACAGMKLWKPDENNPNKRKPLLYYDIPNRGKGLNKVIAKALMSARGNMEIVDARLEEGIVTEASVVNGERNVERIEAWGALVRVRDILTGTVTMGRSIEPMFARKRDGGWFATPEPAGSAYTKALRNGILDHFEAVNAPLLAAIEAEFNAGADYFSGTVDGAVAGQAWRDQALTKQAAAHEGRIGSREAQVLHRRIGEAEVAAGQPPGSLVSEFKDFAHHKWPGVAISDLPVSVRSDLDEWLEGKRKALGVNGTLAGPEPESPADLATPTESEQVNIMIDELVEAGRVPRDVADGLKQVRDPKEREKAARIAADSAGAAAE